MPDPADPPGLPDLPAAHKPGRLETLAATIERASRLALDATEKIGSRSPATILVWGDKIAILVLGVFITAGLWFNVQQTKSAAEQAARERGEARQDSIRGDEARDRERSLRDAQASQQLGQVIDHSRQTLEALRDNTRSMLIVKGAIDEFRAESKRVREATAEQSAEIKKLRDVIEKLNKCLDGWRVPGPFHDQ